MAPRQRRASDQQERLRGGVRLVDVTFRYGAETRPVLDEPLAGIEPGELVAIAGPSGSGKSTIMRLLLGFEEPEQGSVLYDDHAAELARRRAPCAASSAWCSRTASCVPGTIHENLARRGHAHRA